MNMPGDEYIAAMMRRRVSGLASAALAISPATSARSTLPSSSSGTFSVLPLVLRVCRRSAGSCALRISANASPKTGKPPPGVAVARTSVKSAFIQPSFHPLGCFRNALLLLRIVVDPQLGFVRLDEFLHRLDRAQALRAVEVERRHDLVEPAI